MNTPKTPDSAPVVAATSDLNGKKVPQQGSGLPRSWGGIEKTEKCCLCRGCNEVFNSVYGFDLHLAGPPTARYCLTPEEMEAKGMVLNRAGRWISGARLEADVPDYDRQ